MHSELDAWRLHSKISEDESPEVGEDWQQQPVKKGINVSCITSNQLTCQDSVVEE